MHSPLSPPDVIGSLIEDAEVRRLMIRMEQAERLMCEALHADDYVNAARYRRLCASACAACMELLTD